MSETIGSGEADELHVEEFRRLCREIVADSPGDDDFHVDYFKHGDIAVKVMADICPQKTGLDCEVEMFGSPVKDESGAWVLPVSVYKLDPADKLHRFFRIESDQSMVWLLTSPMLRDLLNINEPVLRHIPAELVEIINRDPDAVIDPITLIEAIFEPAAPERAAEALGVDSVSNEELDEIIEILRAIKARPGIIEGTR